MRKLWIVGMTIIAISMLSAKTTQQDTLAKSMERGKELYTELCITCHLDDGKGIVGVFPPLAQSDFFAKSPEKAIRVVKYGQEGEIKVNGVVYNNLMPSPGVSDQEVADLVNYIQNSWGNKGKMVTVKEVEKVAK